MAIVSHIELQGNMALQCLRSENRQLIYVLRDSRGTIVQSDMAYKGIAKCLTAAMQDPNVVMLLSSHDKEKVWKVIQGAKKTHTLNEIVHTVSLVVTSASLLVIAYAVYKGSSKDE